jgi:hypothetical protein
LETLKHSISLSSSLPITPPTAHVNTLGHSQPCHFERDTKFVNHHAHASSRWHRRPRARTGRTRKHAREAGCPGSPASAATAVRARDNHACFGDPRALAGTGARCGGADGGAAPGEDGRTEQTLQGCPPCRAFRPPARLRAASCWSPGSPVMMCALQVSGPGCAHVNERAHNSP